jgi:hypothetical protein
MSRTLTRGVAQVFLLTWAFDHCSLPCSKLGESSETGRGHSQQGVWSSSMSVVDDVDSVHVCSDVPQFDNAVINSRGGTSSGGIHVGMEEGVVKEGVERAVGALSRVGPSIVCAGAAECGAFLLGASTGMPAVISFR